jgi:hypothetical protein
MSYDRRPPKPDNTALWILLVLGGGAILVVVLICGGLIWLFTSVMGAAEEGMKEFSAHVKEEGERNRRRKEEVKAAESVARTFLENCRAGRVNAAYGATSNAYRQRVSEKQLQDLLDRNQVAQDFGGALDNFTNLGGQNTFRHTFMNRDNVQVDMTVQVAQEGGVWRVDHLAVDVINKK